MEDRLPTVIRPREQEQVCQVVSDEDFPLTVLPADESAELSRRPRLIRPYIEQATDDVRLPLVERQPARLQEPQNVRAM
ncbi:hypothetical protein [Microbacterium sp. 20-116]|uniref:hypothetical protein n=1 Tax=Microbacterium sp. 20-116 TaxID=3239883 RepID=UPI0034E197DC